MWIKKNWNKIPESLRQEINWIKNDKFVIWWYFEIENDKTIKGSFPFLSQIWWELNVWDTITYLPPISNWRYSKRNIDGIEIKHKELPKIQKTFYVGEFPNFWDWEKGSHELYRTQMVFQKEYLPWEELEIEISCIKKIWENHIYRVSILCMLDKYYEDSKLLYVINLAQENFWKISIIDEIDNSDDYLKHLSVSWDIFPPWKKEDDIIRILSKYPSSQRTPELSKIIEKRREFLLSLPSKNPIMIHGLWWAWWYFGLKITDEIVVFENIKYGNAIYILYKNWEELSKLTKKEILHRNEEEYERVVHWKYWEKKVKFIVQSKLGI